MNKTEEELVSIERKSSAVTLSDMEVFIFPELMYSLVLANIMSPRIWLWRDDPWFRGMGKMKPYRRITRLKQYIMDHYMFNLDLETWGLTSTEKELARFRNFINEDTLAQSNALFGYEGDKYYFDIDIRTHFGLDKYGGNVIPYWKTETVEAMDAFEHKPNYQTGAGECVSLAALYAAALFVICRIPLKDIYLMATPLHSQNFMDIEDGILTNNRRIVTKNMWFNGTALSAQARRALENERITIVAHETGWIHTVYEQATINPGVYARFRDRLSEFLKVKLSHDILGNFLRHSPDLQKCFQIKCQIHGADHYIQAERAFSYENGSPYSLADNTRDKLLAEIDREEFACSPLPNRIKFNDLEDFVRMNSINLDVADDVEKLKEQFVSECLHRDKVMAGLMNFCHIKPQLPEASGKKFSPEEASLEIGIDMSREEIVDRLESIRGENTMADLAFYAYRDLTRTESDPFLIAAVQRNPVSTEGARQMDVNEIVKKINSMANDSIYDEPGRLAQPDEVWNYERGDGLEKSILLANIIRARSPDERMQIEISGSTVLLRTAGGEYSFASIKELKEQTWAVP